MTPGPAVLLPGEVWHTRLVPTRHQFRQPVVQIWIDPDEPAALAPGTRWYSDRGAAPFRFRRDDHLEGGDEPLGDTVRRLLATELGRPVDGPLRTWTQPRIWGWLFNPLTVHLAWTDPAGPPDAALLEVTNTPWKERHRYAVELTPVAGGGVGATFAKRMHVSPFLERDLQYRFEVRDHGERRDLRVDVIEPESGREVLRTGVTAHPTPATGRTLRRAAWHTPAATHRVSLGIHLQALQLWWKRVRVVPHPDRLRGEIAA